MYSVYDMYANIVILKGMILPIIDEHVGVSSHFKVFCVQYILCGKFISIDCIINILSTDVVM